MASCTVVIFSASSSGISVSNSSSRAITSSTVSRESAPRSSTKEALLVTSSSLTPSCSATIFLTRSSMVLIPCSHSYLQFREAGLRVVYRNDSRFFKRQKHLCVNDAGHIATTERFLTAKAYPCYPKEDRY